MSALSRSGLAAGLILAVLSMTDVAYGGVEKFFISGNSTTCQQVFSALEAQHSSVFPPGTFGTVNAQIRVTPLANGFYSGGGQSVEVSGVIAGQTIFNWTETTTPPPLRGFDAVSIKAGNGRTVHVYTPDATAGTNLTDLNTTSKITEVLFCADSNVTIVTGGPLCDLTSNALGDVCSAVGAPAVVDISGPDLSQAQTCACGVVIDVCNPDPVCDPLIEQCETLFPAGSCDPGDPNNPDTGLLETACCLLSDQGTDLTTTSVPFGTSAFTAHGSHICSVKTTYSAAGGATTTRTCLPHF